MEAGTASVLAEEPQLSKFTPSTTSPITVVVETASGMRVRAKEPPTMIRFPAASYWYVRSPSGPSALRYTRAESLEPGSWTYSVLTPFGRVRSVRRLVAS
jgi:hypothetical protein